MFKAAALAAASSLSEDDYKFMSYVSEFGKNYPTVEEFMLRQQNFLAKDAEINAFNAGNNTHVLGHNHLSDLTKAEMKQMLGYKADPTKKAGQHTDSVVLASSIDWRNGNAVTAVKNQGQCGSCWAFSTTGTVEGANAQSTGTLRSFSEQQLVDCDTSTNQGCRGGLMDNAMQYIESHPLELESEYPYTAVDTASCYYNAGWGVGRVSSYVDIAQSAYSLKASITVGPTAVAIEADQTVFNQYRSGVITSGCGTQLDHGVLAVGYGTENGSEYFLVKNSWGASWGEAGYVKLGTNNVCGILTTASRAIY